MDVDNVSPSAGTPSVDFVQGFRAVVDALRSGGPGIEVTDESFLGGLEVLYSCIVARERDFRTAAEVGQMLVERNKLLTEQLEEAESEWKDKVSAQEERIQWLSSAVSRHERTESDASEAVLSAKADVAELQRRYDLLASDHAAAVDSHARLAQDRDELAQQVKALRVEVRAGNAYRERNRQLFAEMDDLKASMALSMEENASLRKANASLTRDVNELRNSSGGADIHDFEVQRLQKQVTEAASIKEQNRRLKGEMEKLLEANAEVQSIISENESLTEAVNSLMKANRHFRAVQEEDKRLLHDAQHAVAELKQRVDTYEMDGCAPSSRSGAASIEEEMQARVISMLSDPTTHGDALRAFVADQVASQVRAQELALDEAQAKANGRHAALDERENALNAIQKDLDAREQSLMMQQQQAMAEQQGPRESSHGVASTALDDDDGAGGGDDDDDDDDDVLLRDDSMMMAKPIAEPNTILVESHSIPTSSTSTLDFPRVRSSSTASESSRTLSNEEEDSAVDVGVFARLARRDSFNTRDKTPRKTRSRSSIGRPIGDVELLSDTPRAKRITRKETELLQRERNLLDREKDERRKREQEKEAIALERARLDEERKAFDDQKESFARDSEALRVKMKALSDGEEALSRMMEDWKKVQSEKDHEEARLRQELADARERIASEPLISSTAADVGVKKGDGHRDVSTATMVDDDVGDDSLVEFGNVSDSSPSIDASSHPDTSSTMMHADTGETLHRLLFSSLNLAGALNDLAFAIVNRKTEAGIRKRDFIARHLCQHAEIAQVYADTTSDDLRRAQIANAVAQLKSLETPFYETASRVLDGQADHLNVGGGRRARGDSRGAKSSSSKKPLLEPMDGGDATTAALHRIIRDIASANNEIATACTLCFLSKSFESIECAANAAANDPSVQDAISAHKARLLELAPRLVVSSKVALSSPKSGVAKTKLLQMLDRTEQARKNALVRRDGGGSSVGRDVPRARSKVDVDLIKQELRSQMVGEDHLEDEEGTTEDNDEDDWTFLDDLYSKDEQTIREEFIKLKRESVRRRREEKRYIRMVMDVRAKLNDSNLAVMHKTMRSVLSFTELLQLSNACINNALKESRDMFKLPGLKNPSLMALCIDLLMEVAVLMKRNNDFSEGINNPTLRKLEKFNEQFQRKEREKKPAQRSGFLSWMWGGKK